MNNKEVKDLVLKTLQEAGLPFQQPTAVAPRPAPVAPQQPAVPTQAPVPQAPRRLKTTIVKFEQNTKTPYQVKFSERGFSIDDTRLSFELLDQALSKNFTITLKGGTGLVLTPVRMQKIMKYRDLY